MTPMFAPLAAALAAASAQPAAEAAQGRALFETMGCYECHGYLGQGGAAGPALAPKPQALAYFQAYVRAPRGQMPPYTRAILSDGQLAAIHAYLGSIPPAKPPDEIPLLRPAGR